MSAQYFSPTGLDDAIALLAGGNIRPLAGGTDIFPALGTTPLSHDLLDISRIPALKEIVVSETGVRIGAAATWSEIVAADLPRAFEGLKAAAREVGGRQIQNAGTLAGNICNASPAADSVPPLLTLGAEVELTGPGGRRCLPLENFIKGPRRTDCGHDELVTAVLAPTVPKHARGAFQKLGSRRYLVISITMVAVLIGIDAKGRIDFARVAVGAASPVARRLNALEADLMGRRVDEVALEVRHLAQLDPISDIRADTAFRRDAVAGQIRRAIAAAGVGHG